MNRPGASSSLWNIGVRRRQPELMDQPDLEEKRHVHALQALERINAWSGSARILWRPILACARKNQPRPLRILDIATGAGDLPMRLWHKARRAGVPLSIEGCDISARAVEYARQRAAEQKADVRFFQRDVESRPLPAGYDVIFCSLFLHHLDENEAAAMLRRMADAAVQLVLVSDLRRSVGGLLLSHIAVRLLTASPVVHEDGPASVRGAFTLEEVGDLIERAGLEGATLEKRWPFRFLLTWRRP